MIPQRPFVCNLCGNPCMTVNKKIVCVYDKVIIEANFKPFKDLDIVIYSPKELEDLEAKAKEQRKAEHAAMEKAKREYLIKQQESEKNGKTS